MSPLKTYFVHVPARSLLRGLLVFTMVLGLVGSAQALTLQDTQTVLLLHSYHPGLSWTDDITSSIKRTFAASDKAIALHVEYLDTKRRREPEYNGKYLDDFMSFKLKNVHFDLVIVADNEAFNFALKHRNDLFAGKPIIFCGVNGFEPSQIAGLKGITGVAEVPDLTATVTLIEKLHPETKELIIIGSAKDPTGIENFEHFNSIEPLFQGLKFTYLNDFVMEDLLVRLKKLKHGQVVFTSLTIKDKQGNFYGFAEATNLLHDDCSVPIYSGWDFFLGHGIVGGKLISGRVQGREAAKLALAVLNGTDPTTLAVISTPGSQYMFDYAELKNHHVDFALLPKASTIINQPATHYTLRKTTLWSGLSITVLFVFFSGALLALIRHKQRLESNLRESEARFKDIALSIGDGIWEVDSQGAYQYCSDKFCALLGYTPEEILGKTPYDFMSSDQAKKAKKFMRENIAEQRSFQDFETWSIHKNGSQLCLLTSGTPILAADGSLLGFRGIDKDITAKQIAEAAATQQRAEFKAIFNCFSDAIVFVDSERKIQRINPAFSQMLGYKPEEVIGRTTRMIYADPDNYLTQGHKRFNPSTTVDHPVFENEYLCKNKTSFTGETLGVRVTTESGEVLGYLGVIRDISQRKQTEQERTLLMSAIAQAAETIVITDTQGTIQYTNPAFEKLSGYSSTEALGQNPRILKSDTQDHKFYRELWDTITNGTTWSGRLVNTKKDGTLYTEEATISPVYNNSGAITNFVAVKRDITQEIALEKHLFESQKLEIIGTLASGIAHDFNNILAPIIGYAYLMQDQTGRDEQDYERLSVISASAQRAKELVEQILNFSRLSDERQEPLQLKQQIEDTVVLLRASIPTTIEFSLDLHPLQILGTSTRIHQVLLNLCTNAAQAMNKTGGSISIALQPTELEGGNKEALPAGRYALISISDTGAGIAPDVLPQIFNPYFTTKDVGEGSGIGLATVQRIIVSLGGSIRVESQLDKGTTFHILLPVFDGKEIVPTPVTRLTLPAGNKHLLVVDDEELLTSVSTAFLEDLGYRVTSFNRAYDALNAFKDQPDTFDLLLTDLTMPELTGVELAQQINKIRPLLPIILCTGLQNDMSYQDLATINLLKVLQKPDIFAELAFSLQQHFADN